jgi:hypothetical protein
VQRLPSTLQHISRSDAGMRDAERLHECRQRGHVLGVGGRKRWINRPHGAEA